MKTAIIYATKHGCSEKCAQALALELTSDIYVTNLETTGKIDLIQFDTVIIGGSIHAGTINRKLKKFMDSNIETLLTKKLGLFLCCMFEGDKALEQFRHAFPESMRNKALAHGLFGGEFDFDKMNFIEKAIIKKVANVEKSVSQINYSNITDFAQKIIL